MAAKDITKLVFKGILLYATFIVCLLSAMGIDGIYEKGYFLIDIIICAVLIYACYKTISEEEFNILTFYKLFTDKNEEDDKW